jgi:hypothetical protein
MVPLLLRHLNEQEYGMWLIFSAICGATVQLQSAIQGVSIKEIAIAYGKGAFNDFHRSIFRSRNAYNLYAVIVAGPILVFGVIYFPWALNADRWDIASWIVLIGSYSLVYKFAPNNAILLATDAVGSNSNINTCTRIIYISTTLILLNMGFFVLAPCLGMGLSAIFGVTLNTIYARRRVASFVPKLDSKANTGPSGNISRYALYTMSAYMLYSGALVIAAPLFPSQTASYGLALQTSALLSAVALAPLQVRLGRLVRTDEVGARHELRIALVVCNLLFASGYACLMGIAPSVLRFIGASATLPETYILMLMYAAFVVELNISIFANQLTAKGHYSFTRQYAFFAFIALLAGTITAWFSGVLWIGFLLVPFIIQVTLNLPLIIMKSIANLNPPEGSDD